MKGETRTIFSRVGMSYSLWLFSNLEDAGMDRQPHFKHDCKGIYKEGDVDRASLHQRFLFGKSLSSYIPFLFSNCSRLFGVAFVYCVVQHEI